MKIQLNKLCVAAAVAFLSAASLMAQECYTPLEWIPKNYVSNFDRNKNFVDDEIEQKSPGSTVNIIVCLNACVSFDELQRISQTIGGMEPVYRSPYLSIMLFENVTREDAIALGQDDRVAMVEMEREVTVDLNVSMRAARIRSTPAYPGTTVQDIYPTLNGTGVNIAIIDSGIDNGPTGVGHESLPNTKYVAGYNAFTNLEVDPDDDNGHGTHVAGIALGTGGGAGTFRGAAPGAKFIDIKAANAGGGLTALSITRSFDKVIQRRVAWNIKIANMSFGSAANSNGTDAMSQHVNRMVREGVLAVISAGNSGPANVIGPPGSADFALTVANAYDNGTDTRVGDVLWNTSSRGPRLSDGDGMTQDERKPDVAAYGAIIRSAQFNTVNGYVDKTGTSMAAPQVAGFAALILQASPTMTPLSVKNLIESTAEDFGPAGWDVGFGNGIINGYQAINQILTALKTDVAFSVWCNRPGAPVWYLSPDLIPVNTPILESSPNSVQVTIRNNGPNVAVGVQVRVGIYNFSNSTTDFDICLKTGIPPIPAGGTYTFTCPWTPEVNGVPPGTVHACLKAYIIYPNDSNFGNNCAQHNVDIKQTHSPAVFNMTVVNPTGKTMNMDLVTDPPQTVLQARGWQLTFSEQNFTMGPTDCPRTVTMEMEAVGAPFGAEMPVTINVRGREGAQGEFLDLGGVQIVAQNANGTPRPPDGLIFKGIRHISLGPARLSATPSELTVSHIGPDGGVQAWLGEADFWKGTVTGFDPNMRLDGDRLTFTPVGSVAGAPNSIISTVTVTDEANHASLAADFGVPGNTLTVEVFDGGTLVGTDITSNITFANVQAPISKLTVTPFRQDGGNVYAEVSLDATTSIEILGASGATMVNGDRVVVHSGTQPPLPDFVSHVDVMASGTITSFGVTDEAGGAYERPFRALGNPVLEWQAQGQTLKASRVTARSAVGARAEVPGLQRYNLFWAAVPVSDVPVGTHLYVTARGNMSVTGGSSDLGNLWAMRDISDVKLTANQAHLGATGYNVEVYNGATLVHSATGLPAAIGASGGWPDGGGHAVAGAANRPSFRMYWTTASNFMLADGWAGSGTEIRVIPTGVAGLLGVTEVGVFVIGLDEIVIISEEASSSLPVSVSQPKEDIPFTLFQNYPNPFDQRTIFKFELLTAARIELDVYNLLGDKIATVAAKELAQGTHEIEWKRPTNTLPSGTYIYRLRVHPVNSQQTFELQRQMILLD